MAEKQTELVELTRRMVATPSVNPQDTPRTDPPYGEQAIAALVLDWLQAQGLDASTQEVLPGRQNVLAWGEGTDRSRTLLLCAHTDTVDVKDMAIEPFVPQLRQGRLYGRGACDDKGPLATIMIAFRDRIKHAPLPCNLALLASCGEEYNLDGARFCAKHLASKLTAAVFAEPTNLNVVVAHKGVVRVRLVSKGKSAHSSTPQLGQNAIYPMAQAISAVQEYAQTLSAQPQHPRLGHETLSVTVVQGGQQINVIPDRCEAQIDWRLLPERDPQQGLDELSAHVRAIAGPTVTVQMINHYESMETDAAHPIVAALINAAQKTGQTSQTIAEPYATDASAFTTLNIPTVVFGPGSAAQAHTRDEYIEIEKLERGLAAYQAFLEGDWGI